MKPYYNETIIVGGGPAGLAAALALSNKGASCTVVDFNKPPIDKPCGEGLMPDSLKELSQLGVNLPETSGFPFTGIRFKKDKLSIESDFPEGQALGIRRKVLHQALVDAAMERPNIRLIWNSRVQLQKPGVITIDNNDVGYKWLVGADGLMSSVRKWSGLDRDEHVTYRYGFRRHYRIEPWTDRMELHWADCGQMYVTPVGPQEVCVAFLGGNQQLRLEEALPHFTELYLRLVNSTPVSKMQGAVTATRRLKRVATGSVALVGDASGSVDAITGEGMALSFRQAIALADALEHEDLSVYNDKHRAISVLPSRMASLMLLLAKYPRLQTEIFAALSMTPDTFEKLLAAHVGKISLPITLLNEIPKVSWNLLCRLSATGRQSGIIPKSAPILNRETSREEAYQIAYR